MLTESTGSLIAISFHLFFLLLGILLMRHFKIAAVRHHQRSDGFSAGRTVGATMEMIEKRIYILASKGDYFNECYVIILVASAPPLHIA